MQERARQLRSALTPAEQHLWRHLRKRQLRGFEFRRQHPMGRFILDFYCPAAKLVVEVDGEVHAEQMDDDAERTQWLESERACRVLRFTNSEVRRNTNAVLEAILTALTGPPP